MGRQHSGTGRRWRGLAGRPALGNRLEAELGYALPVGHGLMGTPRFGVGASERGRDYRLGYSLAALERGTRSFELGVDVQRRETPSPRGGANHGVRGLIRARW